MRASAGITWHLLLSLSFLFQIVQSDSANPTTLKPTVTDPVTTATTARPPNGTTGTTTTVKSVEKETTLTPATVKPTAVTSTPVAVTTVSTPKPSDKPTTNSTQPPATNTNQTTPPATTKSTDAPAVVTGAVAPAVTPPPPPLPPVTTAAPQNNNNNNNNNTGSSSAPTVGASVTLAATSNSGGGATGGNAATVGTIHTNAASRGQTPTAQTTAPAKTTQDSGNRGVVTPKVTTTPQSLERTSSNAPVIPGLKASTLNPVDNVGIQTGANLPQTTAATGAGAATTAGSVTASTAASFSVTVTTSAATQKTFSYSLNKGDVKEEEKGLMEVCRQLMMNMENGDCKLKFQHHKDKIHFDSVEISGHMKPALANQYYEAISKNSTDNKTLIAILASCGALLIMIVILAVCASHHRRPYHENQQHLTEELHTVENGYHDNPTLEVMEVQPEMQEKKMALNGEFNDGWIVPMDNLPKGEIPEEEDTHL